ncbi:MAG: hypothetical protein KJ968_01595 [Nanoarchaeota archaeon]|nr:hypothetical protein [Nanoarchaeota archaeon]
MQKNEILEKRMYFGFDVKPEKIEEYKKLEPQKAKIFSACIREKESNIDEWVLNISINLIGEDGKIKQSLGSIIYEKERVVNSLIRDLKIRGLESGKFYNSLKELRGKYRSPTIPKLDNQEIYAYVIENKVVALSAYK